jgi:hypothetical protein
MTQDVVTAAPSADTLQFQDAQAICDKLNHALAYHSYRPAPYSEPTRALFQLAWAVASHKHSRQVTVFHLAYALACNHPEVGRDLAEYLEGDAGSFPAGCIMKLQSLGLLQRDEGIVDPAVDAVRWLGAAIAMKNDKRSELRPEDLVRVVQEDAIPGTVRNHLRAAARLGVFRRGAFLGESLPQLPAAAPASPPEIIKHMQEIEKGGADSGLTVDITNMIKLFDDFEDRYSADVDEHKQALARIEASIEKRLPRAPSGIRLAATIVAVLILGSVAGLALTNLQWRSFVVQTVSGTK